MPALILTNSFYMHRQLRAQDGRQLRALRQPELISGSSTAGQLGRLPVCLLNINVKISGAHCWAGHLQPARSRAAAVLAAPGRTRLPRAAPAVNPRPLPAAPAPGEPRPRPEPRPGSAAALSAASSASSSSASVAGACAEQQTPYKCGTERL